MCSVKWASPGKSSGSLMWPTATLIDAALFSVDGSWMSSTGRRLSGSCRRRYRRSSPAPAAPAAPAAPVAPVAPARSGCTKGCGWIKVPRRVAAEPSEDGDAAVDAGIAAEEAAAEEAAVEEAAAVEAAAEEAVDAGAIQRRVAAAVAAVVAA